MKQGHIGQKVRELRTSAGLTQDELAVASGLTIRSIQRIENGITTPRGDSLKRLATALKAPIESLASAGFIEDDKGGDILKSDPEVSALLILSAFGFLIQPLLGILFPMTIWLIFRNKIDGVKELGLRVLKLEVLWCIALACINGYLLARKIFHLTTPIPANVKTFAMLNILLYCANAFLITGLFIRWFSSRKKGLADIKTR